METGFSLCNISNREKLVFISWDPCNENRVFPVGKKLKGKTLFNPVLALYWPCTGLQCMLIFALSCCVFFTLGDDLLIKSVTGRCSGRYDDIQDSKI